MRYRLGIDFGVASVSIVALELDDKGQPIKPVWHAVRIFQEPLENAQGILKAKKAQRREARLSRRQIDRKASRLRRIAYLAPLLGLDRHSILPHPGNGFSALRARAAREQVSLPELFSIMLRLAKKRGYKGEFKVKTEKESGLVETGAKTLHAEMAKLATRRGLAAVTLGEYLHYRISEQKLPGRLKIDQAGVDNLYALRNMLAEEFAQIWSTQAKYHQRLKDTHQDKSIQEHFHAAIFFQRPLKSPAFMVGHCQLEKKLPRAPMAQPAAQRFRIEKTLHDLRWGSGKNSAPLTEDQRDAIRACLQDPDKLNQKGVVSFEKIHKHLKKAGCADDKERAFNLERESRNELLGDRTSRTFKKLELLTPWQELEKITQIQVINFLADLGSPEQLNADDWDSSFCKKNGEPRIFSAQFIGFINKLRENKKFARLSKMGFDAGRSSYCIKALDKLTNWMQSPSWNQPDVDYRVDEEAAITACYPGAYTQTQKTAHLQQAERTYNDVVDGALRQLRTLINCCIDELGECPSEIILESTRELGAGVTRRNEWENISKKNQQRRKEASEMIEAHGKTATATAITCYLLWEEQENCCPYCANKLSLQEALDGNSSNFEHILPRNLTQVGKKRSEQVLAHRSCNDQKGARTPMQAFGDDPERKAQIAGHAKRFEKLSEENKSKNKPLSYAYWRKAKLLLIDDFEHAVMDDESIAGFPDRHLQDTSWIAKAATLWLSTICGNIFCSKGIMTGKLRAAWKLNTIIPAVRLEEGYRALDQDGKEISQDNLNTCRSIDKRIDHRHHLIDALVVALTSRGLYQKLARNYKDKTEAIAQAKKETRALSQQEKHIDWQVAPPIDKLRAQAMELVKTPNLTHKTDRHVNGQFFQDTPYRINAEKKHLVSRKKLLDLAAKSKDATEKNIRTIVSCEVREIVAAAFAKNYAQALEDAIKTDLSKEIKAALSKEIRHPRYNTVIRSVRCFHKIGRGFANADTATTIAHQDRHGVWHKKALLVKGYACLEITLAEGIWQQTKLITMADFHSAPSGTPNTRRFFKGDTVTYNNKQYLIHMLMKESGGSIVMAPITEARPIKKLNKKDGKTSISGKKLAAISLHL